MFLPVLLCSIYCRAWHGLHSLLLLRIILLPAVCAHYSRFGSNQKINHRIYITADITKCRQRTLRPLSDRHHTTAVLRSIRIAHVPNLLYHHACLLPLGCRIHKNPKDRDVRRLHIYDTRNSTTKTTKIFTLAVGCVGSAKKTESFYFPFESRDERPGIVFSFFPRNPT